MRLDARDRLHHSMPHPDVHQGDACEHYENRRCSRCRGLPWNGGDLLALGEQVKANPPLDQTLLGKSRRLNSNTLGVSFSRGL